MLSGEYLAMERLAKAAYSYSFAYDRMATALSCGSPEEIVTAITDRARLAALELTAAILEWKESK